MRMLNRLLLLLAFFPALFLSGPLVITGSDGVPTQVQDQSGNWSTPIKVYSDNDVEIFIPDMTTVGAKFQDEDLYSLEGIYRTQLTFFYKTDKMCLGQLTSSEKTNVANQEACRDMRYEADAIMVDTKTTMVQLATQIRTGADAQIHPEHVLSPKFSSPLAALSTPMAKAISATSELMSHRVQNNTELGAEKSRGGVSELPSSEKQSMPGADENTSRKDGQVVPLKKFDASVSPPVLLSTNEPRLPKDARRAKVRANVLVNCWIEPDGTTSHVKMVRIIYIDDQRRADLNSLTEDDKFGFGTSATESVSKYRFKPAMKDGKPVLVELNVEVNFL
jgi:Gram-negative bacterial TonB protein C-terminal